MSEYPKKCTREEATECVKAGGKARFHGTMEKKWTNLFLRGGDACFTYESGTICPSEHFCVGWIYEITEPAPSASKKTHTTAEAVAWVLRSGEEMTGKRCGEDGDQFGCQLRLILDNDHDVRCFGETGTLGYIPGNAIWTKKQTKPEPISRDVTLVGDGDVRGLVEAHVEEIKSHWTGKVRVRWTVEAVD